MSGTLWINGRFRPLESPLIPAAHPLTLHGVGVFETLRLVAGRAPLLERPLDHARRSCAALELKLRAAAWPAPALGRCPTDASQASQEAADMLENQYGTTSEIIADDT